MKTQTSVTDILKKMAAFCSRQEKCIEDIRIKLSSYEISEEEKDSIINKLIEDKYIDEYRYARCFIADKLRINGWGKVKIREALQQKNIPETIISNAINNIQQDEYMELLKKILNKKLSETNIDNPELMYYRLLQFAISKGFEEELAVDFIHKLVKENL